MTYINHTISPSPFTYGYDIVRGFVNNIMSNGRFYSVKMIIDFLGETELLHDSWSKTKHNGFILMMLIGSSLPELLTSYDTSPKNYRAFLTRYFNVRHDNKLLLDINRSFCKQCHRYSIDSNSEQIMVDSTDSTNSTGTNDSMDSVDSTEPDDKIDTFYANEKNQILPESNLKDCSGSAYDCLRFNMIMFKKNMKLFCKLYGKLYAVGYILTFIKNKDILKILPIYIKNVFRSSFAMSLMYLVLHTYLSIIDRMQIPKKIHYHIGLVISTISLLIVEDRHRLGAICQFMASIYANMFMYYSTPKNDTFWKVVIFIAIALSLKHRGCNRTLLSLI
jgi:hypothetical protein